MRCSGTFQCLDALLQSLALQKKMKSKPWRRVWLGYLQEGLPQIGSPQMWSDPSLPHDCTSTSYTRQILTKMFSLGTPHSCWREVLDWQDSVIHLRDVSKHRLDGDICCHFLVRSRIRKLLLFIWGWTWPYLYLGPHWFGRTKDINRGFHTTFHPKFPLIWPQTRKKDKAICLYKIFI